MKFLIASDIHGSALFCEQLLAVCKRENADRLLLLGDLLYHGPRNDLPGGYAPKCVIAMLNSIKNDLLCVRGNCDAEVDQMVLDFPIMADYCVIPSERGIIFATHGHIYNPHKLPTLKSGDILLYGHTHVPECSRENEIMCLNPGSVSIPKGGSYHGYMTFDGTVFSWKDLDGVLHNSLNINEI